MNRKLVSKDSRAQDSTGTKPPLSKKPNKERLAKREAITIQPNPEGLGPDINFNQN